VLAALGPLVQALGTESHPSPLQLTPTNTDLLIRGGRVFTVDDALPWVEAVAVSDGRISWVGSDADAPHARETIDARGRLVLPGFVDAHNHVRLGSVGSAVPLAGARSLEEIRSRVAAFAREHAAEDWIEGEGWNYSAIPGGIPSARDLEGITQGKPAFLFSYDVHTVWMNREALESLGIVKGSGDVPFGRVARDGDGEPTGFLTDFAVMGLSRDGQAALQGVLPSFSEDRRYERLLESLDMAARFGITTVVEPQNSVDDLPLFARARDEGALRSRLVAALFHPPGTTDGDLDAFEDARWTYDDDRLRVGPIKLYIDDVIEPHTAAMLEPYANRADEVGHLFWDPDAFADLIVRLERRGFQTFTHATGDRGIRTTLDAVEHARAVNGPHDARHQIVHVECVHPDDLPRFAELGVVACMQPRHAAPEIVGEWRENVGHVRWPSAFPWRSLHDAGATLAFSSDWNVAEMDPMVGIYTALTRASLDGSEPWTPDQRLDLATTIRAYTLGSAYANFAEDDRGSITVGKYADIVIVSHDLFALEDPRAVLDARVELTMVGGEVVVAAER
jgi:predicted amidohydrolase YtcJ